MEDNRGDIMQILSASPALIASVVIFVVCVVIGFFGDKRLKDEKMLKEQSEKDENKVQTTSDIESSGDNKEDSPLITSQNINNLDSNNNDLSNLYSIGNNVNNNVNNVAMPEVQDSNQNLNDSITSSNSVINEEPLAPNPSFNMPVQNEPVNPEPINQSSAGIEPNLNTQNTLNSTNNGMPQPFDGQITSDDSINNMF
jgi:predicted RND superfamily exporter protein